MSARKAKKTRFSESHHILFDRNIIEVLEIAQLLDEKGLLSSLQKRDRDFLQDAVTNFSRKAKIPLAGAKRVFKLMGLLHNKELIDFLKTCDMLTVFSEESFTKVNGTIAQNGGVLCLELLEALVNGEDPGKHEQTLSRRKRLHALVLDYDAEARDACVVIFFKIVSVIATLCSFINDSVLIEASLRKEEGLKRIVDVLSLYMSKKWLFPSLQKNRQREMSLPRMVDGWILVTEVLKVQLQELWYTVRNESGCGDGRHLTSKISKLNVLYSVHRWCHHVIAEFGAWLYTLLEGRIGKNEFIKSVGNVLKDICDQLMVDVDSEAIKSLPSKVVVDAVDKVDCGEPTMCQVRYEAMSLRPERRASRITSPSYGRTINWNAKEVLLKCRWEQSPVEKKYAAFLAEPVRNQSLGSVAVTTVDIIPETPHDEIVPATPEPQAEANNRKRPASPVTRGRETKARLQVMKEMNLRRLNALNTRTESQTALESITAEQGRSQDHFQHNDQIGERESRPAQVRSSEGHVKQFINLADDGSDVEDDQGEEGRLELSQKTPKASLKRRRDQLSKTLNLALQAFYASFLDWPPVPTNARELPPMSDGSNILSANEEWVIRFFSTRRNMILPDVTKAKSISQYQNHWKALICLELRGAISQEVKSRFPQLVANPLLSWTEDVHQESFVKLKVNDISVSRTLLNMKCTSMNHDLNTRIVKELQGGTLCFGYLETHDSGCSELSMIACRRVHYPREAVTPNGQFSRIDFITVSLAINKNRFRMMNVKQGDFIYLLKACSFSPYIRMYKAMEEMSSLPIGIVRKLCGSNIHVPLPFDSITGLESSIDRGCLQYLSRVRETTNQLDDSQYKAVLSVLCNLGKCAGGSCSMSNVQGPPGTGKTTLILILIGSLMHHSVVGHMGWPQKNQLKGLVEDDKFSRCSTNPNGIRIQVCCPSNQGVDNVLQRLDRDGIPDGNEGKIYPQCVRVARDLYPYGSLQAYSIDEKAKPFDIYALDSKNHGRKYASSPAKKLFAKEAIILFATTATVGSGRMRQLKVPIGYTIIDEAGQSWEPEDLITSVAVANNEQSQYNHSTRVGDHKQLKPVSNAQHMVKRAMRNLWFEYPNQMISLFERLIRNQRCTTEMLTSQYRMHPTIARTHFPNFYDKLVESPVPISSFDAPYNRGWTTEKGGFSPLTVVDISKLPDRIEKKVGEGKYINYAEQEVIVETLMEIRELLGGSLESLVGQIAILLPYRSGIDVLKKKLTGPGAILSDPTLKNGVLISTVDSMQGSQRDVVIFASTRSNFKNEIGFLDDTNRLNVAFSRAQRLLVIIADMSTLSKTDVETFSSYKESCGQGTHGALFLCREPRDGSKVGVSVKPRSPRSSSG